MKLTKQEKQILDHLVRHELEAVQESEKIPDSHPSFMGAAMKYEDALEKILKKLEK